MMQLVKLKVWCKLDVWYLTRFRSKRLRVKLLATGNRCNRLDLVGLCVGLVVSRVNRLVILFRFGTVRLVLAGELVRWRVVSLVTNNVCARVLKVLALRITAPTPSVTVGVWQSIVARACVPPLQLRGRS